MKQEKGKQNKRCYDCIICFDLCKKAVSCSRCNKLLCYHHIKLLGNRCPHCRLEPFAYKQQQLIQSFIEKQKIKIRQQERKNNIFKCLVEGCQFSGKYSAMLFHRKSKHVNEKIEQIIYPEERQRKKMRDAIKKIFLQKYVEKAQKYTQQAMVLYIKSKGVVQLKYLVRMLTHIDNCSNQNCRAVIFRQNYAAIGEKIEQLEIESTCPRAVELKSQF